MLHLNLIIQSTSQFVPHWAQAKNELSLYPAKLSSLKPRLKSRTLQTKPFSNIPYDLSCVMTCHAGIFDNTKQMNPSAQFGFELGSGNAMWAGNVFDLRHKLRVSRHAGLEVVQPSVKSRQNFEMIQVLCISMSSSFLWYLMGILSTNFEPKPSVSLRLSWRLFNPLALTILRHEASLKLFFGWSSIS